MRLGAEGVTLAILTKVVMVRVPQGRLQRGASVSRGNPPLSVPTQDRRVAAVGEGDKCEGSGSGEMSMTRP